MRTCGVFAQTVTYTFKINWSFTDAIANKDGLPAINKLHVTLSGDFVNTHATISFYSQPKQPILLPQTIYKTLRKITGVVNKDNETPFGKLASLPETPTLLYATSYTAHIHN